MGNPRISIALCTYNGERFLGEQLESFAVQSRLPDEVVITDDRSSDSTADIVDQFARRAPFSVRFERNETNLGVTRNFSKAISLCDGDIIFMSDQDDVWLPEKIRRIVETFAQNPRCGLICANAKVVDQSLHSLGYCLWDSLGIDLKCKKEFEGNAFATLLRKNVVTGATSAIRGEFRNLVVPIPQHAPHDHWISQLVAGVAQCILLDEELNLYRQHGGNVVGGKKVSLLQQFRETRKIGETYFKNVLERFTEMRRRLATRGDVVPDVIDLLNKKIAFTNARVRMRQHKLLKFPLLAREAALFHYQTQGQGFKAMLMDLFS